LSRNPEDPLDWGTKDDPPPTTLKVLNLQLVILYPLSVTQLAFSSPASVHPSSTSRVLPTTACRVFTYVRLGCVRCLCTTYNNYPARLFQPETMTTSAGTHARKWRWTSCASCFAPLKFRLITKREK